MSVKNIPIKILNGNSATSTGQQQPREPQQNPQGLPRHYDNDNRSRSGSTFSLHRDPDFEPRFTHSPFPDDSRFPEFEDFDDLRSRFRTPSFGNLSANSPFSSMRRSPVPPFFQQGRQASPGAQAQGQAQAQAHAHGQSQGQAQAQARQQTGRENLRPNSESPKSRSHSRQSRGQCEEVERPAVIPLPPPTSTSRKNSEEKDEKIIEEAENSPYEQKKESEDVYNEELKSPTTNSSRPKIRRKQSSVDYAAKTTAQLDNLERRVEQLRKTTLEAEMEKEELLRALNNIHMHTKMLKNADCEQEEIEMTVDRLLQRTKTVQVSVETPRNTEQKRALDNANKEIDELERMLESDLSNAKLKLETFMNACSSEETSGATCSRFLGIIIECTAEDQKKIKRRLQNMVKNIEDAEKTTADIINDDRE